MKIILKNQFMRIICICLFVFMGVTQVQGQTYQQSLLLNKEWAHQMPNKTTFYFRTLFTDKEQIVKLVVEGVETGDEVRNSYYMSDTIVDNFQPDSVGKSTSGKYIVHLLKPKLVEEILELYEILELIETTLKTKHLRSGTVLEYVVK